MREGQGGREGRKKLVNGWRREREGLYRERKREEKREQKLVYPASGKEFVWREEGSELFERKGGEQRTRTRRGGWSGAGRRNGN